MMSQFVDPGHQLQNFPQVGRKMNKAKGEWISEDQLSVAWSPQCEINPDNYLFFRKFTCCLYIFSLSCFMLYHMPSSATSTRQAHKVYTKRMYMPYKLCCIPSHTSLNMQQEENYKFFIILTSNKQIRYIIALNLCLIPITYKCCSCLAKLPRIQTVKHYYLFVCI